MVDDNTTTINTDFVVKHEEFEGPIAKLLEMIEARKLFINDISLASIADDFIGYTNSLSGENISLKVSFISTSSVLVLIKSKSLLPGLSLTKEEEEKIDDLKYRLFLLDNVRKGMTIIEESFQNTILYEGKQYISKEPIFSPHESINVGSIYSALLEVLSKIPEEPPAKKEVYIEKMISIEEMISSLEERVLHQANIQFSSIARLGRSMTKTEKLSTIVTFLAMLELMRQGIISVEESDDGDFMISKQIIDEETNEAI